MPAVEVWWIWIVAGVLLAAIEIVVPGFFILPFAVGAIVAGVLAYAGLGVAVQWTAFVVVSGVLLPFSLVIAKRITKRQPPGIGANRLVGMRGPITISVNNLKSAGQVRLGGELWRAESQSGAKILIGTVAEVVAVEGTHVVVTEINKET